jgi:hypothetical protein
MPVINVGDTQLLGIAIELCPDVYMIIQRTTSMGSDAVTVYIIRYMLACIRSGW